MRILIFGASTLRDPNSLYRTWLVAGMEALGHQVIAVDAYGLDAMYGPKVMQQLILAYARAYRVEVAFCVSCPIIEPALLESLKAQGVILIGFRYDDLLYCAPGLAYPERAFLEHEWQFDRHCHLSITSLRQSEQVHRDLGLPGPTYVKMPVSWQAIPVRDLPQRRVISYAGAPKYRPGQPKNWRYRAIKALADAGLPVEVHGAAWLEIPELAHLAVVPSPTSPAAQQERDLVTHSALVMAEILEVFQTSQVNLSLLGDYLPVPNPGIRLLSLEICAAGGMQLTDPSPELADHYTYGRDIAVFHDLDELVRQARHYLDHPEEARTMGANGRRALERDGGWEVWWATVAERLAENGVRLPLDSPPVAPDPREVPTLQMAASGLAHAYAAQACPLMATTYFQEILTYAPDDYAAHAGLARLATDPATALSHWRTAAKSVAWTYVLNHGVRFGMAGFGTEFPGAHQSEAACMWFKEATLSNQPDEMAAALLLLVPCEARLVHQWFPVLMSRRHFRPALQVAERLVERWPESEESYRCRGNVRYELGNMMGANEDFEHADAIADTPRRVIGLPSGPTQA